MINKKHDLKRETTLMFRVIKKYDSGDPEILYSERDEENAIDKFQSAVASVVKNDVLQTYTGKEIEFGIYNGCTYIYPKKVAEESARRVISALSGNHYFYAMDKEGLRYAIYIEKMYCIDEVQ